MTFNCLLGKTFRDIYRMQENWNVPLLKKAPFTRVVREIIQNLASDLRITAEALDSLMIITEDMLVTLFSGMFLFKQIFLFYD